MSTADDNNEQYVGGSEEITSNKKESTSCEQNNVDDITKGINSMAMQDDVSTCANCGKVGNSDDMNICNKCKSVKYCNAACKKKHRSKHKKACERRLAELHDERLFKEVEPKECPICMSSETYTSTFQSCCGKRICNGCIYAMQVSEGKDLCAFCRTPIPSYDEQFKRTKKLMDKGNAEAFNMFAGYYVNGRRGIAQDWAKAREFTLKAGELGCASGYYNLGVAYEYDEGRGVEVNMKKAKHYYELAAMMGHVGARHNLGCLEGESGNYQRAMKHFTLAAKAGSEKSLNNIKQGFTNGMITKEEYANALRAYQKRQSEMKSDERDKAAASGMFIN